MKKWSLLVILSVLLVATVIPVSAAGNGPHSSVFTFVGNISHWRGYGVGASPWSKQACPTQCVSGVHCDRDGCHPLPVERWNHSHTDHLRGLEGWRRDKCTRHIGERYLDSQPHYCRCQVDSLSVILFSS